MNNESISRADIVRSLSSHGIEDHHVRHIMRRENIQPIGRIGACNLYSVDEVRIVIEALKRSARLPSWVNVGHVLPHAMLDSEPLSTRSASR